MKPEEPTKKRRAVLGIPLSWRRLGESEHFVVDHDAFHNIVRVTRISDMYPSTAALRSAHDWLEKIVVRFERPNLVLVWDGRRGKLRNDPEFEEAMKQVLPTITQGWREFVSINNTPVVKMQFFRWSQERTAVPIRAFNDEREALDFAIEASQPGERPRRP